jgi:minor extracellular serine protease Vpr
VLRLAASLAVLAAVLTATSAAAPSATVAPRELSRLAQVRSELAQPRVRPGKIDVVRSSHARRVQMIVTLGAPPLAAARVNGAAFRAGGRRRLDVAAGSSQTYLARLKAAQSAAVTELERAIPKATVFRRYGVLLDGLAVQIPPRSMPKLLHLPFVAKVYPNLQYTLSTNRSPGMIGATQLAGAGTGGAGIKIGIVDDGVDPSNPFFNPAGFSYPSGFPKGDTGFTTPKVIVEKSFVGPGAGSRSGLVFDPLSSFHATHVAGIAAGDAGTTAPAGRDHPLTTGLSGVAPRAWIGSYRVFNVPSPIGDIATTAEIIAAFEAAVADGMDVINFSGGGPMTDPSHDALVPAVHNVVGAGVVPVISAGNDREDFGLGTVGSPSTAPDAISVAAVSNVHVFAPTLAVVSPGAPSAVSQIPFIGAGGTQAPSAWGTSDQQLVDVGTIVGTNGKPVEPHLCGGSDPNGGKGTLPAGSLAGAIALVSRGSCTFVSKADRAKAAGAVGIVLVDNRSGEANPIPITLPLPGGMIADLDGASLRSWLDAYGGRDRVRIGRDVHEIDLGRGGTVTSFSSGGPTVYGHQLKPDLAAPGGQILSSTTANAGGPFAVFDGTSMSAPHVSGGVALLLQRHPTWSPQQVKSALVSSAGPAYADTARTTEAPVTLAGSGLVNLVAASDPKIFIDPVSLSFGDLDVLSGSVDRALPAVLSDAGGGAGAWTVEVHSQAQPDGVRVDTPQSVTVPAGGSAPLQVTVHADQAAGAGEGYGYLLLRHGDVSRKVPYFFLVTRPALAGAPVVQLRTTQSGDTRRGTSRVSVYRYPTEPFGPPPNYTGPPMNESGAETLYRFSVPSGVVNAGVAVVSESRGSLVHPWLLGSPNESDVVGYDGTPVNMNNYTLDFQFDVGAAALNFPTPKTYYVAVDSGSDPFTGKPLRGTYVLHTWRNDVTPPSLALVTKTVAAGRPTIVLRTLDAGSGVDPFSLVIGYRNVLVGASAYEAESGLAIFALPTEAPRITGATTLDALSSDFEEAKNIDTTGDAILPNTKTIERKLRVKQGPTVTWLLPDARTCVRKSADLLVVAGSNVKVRAVRFLDGKRLLKTVKRGSAGLYSYSWKTKSAARGRHVLRAVVVDARTKQASASRQVRVCK